MLLPLSSSSGPPKWIYLALVLGLLAVGGIIFMAYKVLGTKSPVLVEQVQQVPAPRSSPSRPRRPSRAGRQADDHRRGESAAARGERRGQGEKSEKAEQASTSITTGKGKESQEGGGVSRQEEGRRRGGLRSASPSRRSPPRDRSTI